ncbi:MAG: DoxX family membrane protein [Bacteroidota bacterium]
MNDKIVKIVQIVLGLLLIVFGANKFFNYMPSPEMHESAADFMAALYNTGYLFKFIGFVEIVSGILILINKWVPFALLLIAPIVVNIILFHLALDLGSIMPGAVILILVVYLFYYYWNKYKPLFGK